MSKANIQSTEQGQISILFWLDSDGFVTISRKLSLEARGRAGGNFTFRSVVDALFDLEGGDVAYEFQEIVTTMVDCVNALGREEAADYFAAADNDTVMHLRKMGLCSGVGEMEARGFFDVHRYKKRA